jgi:hypothetical protein
MADKGKPIQPELGLQSASPGRLPPSAGNAGELRRERGAPMSVQRIVSGGQTGADRAALDFAIAHGIPHGGWCPRGRLAEDGALERCYELRETPDEEYPQRTEWNVRDSDGTVIFSIAPELSGGSKLTAELAAELAKPYLHVSAVRDGANAPVRLRAFVAEHHIRVLNVAGPRASNEPAVARFVIETLEEVFNVKKTRQREWNRYD